MAAKKHIALIGMMGSGKSTTGKVLAKQLQLPFCDTDALAAAAAGMSVADIINQHGEAEFRRREQQALQQALAAPTRQVIATGGGIVLAAANRTALRAQAWVVYLPAAVAVLLARVQETPSQRPLLGEAAAERMECLLAQREGLYQQTAHATVSQHARETARQIADKIANLLEQHTDSR